MKNFIKNILARREESLNDLSRNELNELPADLINLLHAFREYIQDNNLRAIREYAMSHPIYNPKWVATEKSFEFFPEVLRTYLYAIGYNYDEEAYLPEVNFDPYQELSPSTLMDCYRMSRVLDYDAKNVIELIYGYMRGHFPFVVDGEDLCKKNEIELPYSTLDLWKKNTGYCLRISRENSLLFRGDVYNYYMIDGKESNEIKVYLEDCNSRVWLVKDIYKRYWFCVRYFDNWDGRVEQNFELVKDEADGDKHFENLRDTYHYMAKEPYFFSSENYDFILHSDEAIEDGMSEEEWIFEYQKWEGSVPPQLTFRTKELGS